MDRGEALSFGWIIPHALAASSMPGQAGEPLDDDLKWLKAQGIGAIVTVLDVPLDADALKTHGLASLHVRCLDGDAPAPEELNRIVTYIDDQRNHGHAVLVHCFGGIGRTTTTLAAYFIARRHMTAPDAVDDVIMKRWHTEGRPQAVLTARQLDALERYAIARLKKR